MAEDVKISRDQEICQLYTSGLSLRDCGVRFRLSHERVRQILRKAGVFKRVDVEAEHDHRDTFIGVNVTQESKDALKVAAAAQGVSVSRLVSDKIDEMVAKE